jgi:hypothetical protein
VLMGSSCDGIETPPGGWRRLDYSRFGQLADAPE